MSLPLSNTASTRESTRSFSATGPYAIGYVTLKEGPSLLTNYVDCDMKSLQIGQKVKVVFKTTDGAPLPFFTPV